MNGCGGTGRTPYHNKVILVRLDATAARGQGGVEINSGSRRYIRFLLTQVPAHEIPQNRRPVGASFGGGLTKPGPEIFGHADGPPRGSASRHTSRVSAQGGVE